MFGRIRILAITLGILLAVAASARAAAPTPVGLTTVIAGISSRPEPYAGGLVGTVRGVPVLAGDGVAWIREQPKNQAVVTDMDGTERTAGTIPEGIPTLVAGPSGLAATVIDSECSKYGCNTLENEVLAGQLSGPLVVPGPCGALGGGCTAVGGAFGGSGCDTSRDVGVTTEGILFSPVCSTAVEIDRGGVVTQLAGYFGPFVAAGHFIATESGQTETVFDLDTGRALYSVAEPIFFQPVLAANGTLLLSVGVGPYQYSWASIDDPQLHPLALPGNAYPVLGGDEIAYVAPGEGSAAGTTQIDVQTLQGQPVGAVTTSGEAYGVRFDGSRLLWMTQPCSAQRIFTWTVPSIAAANAPYGPPTTIEAPGDTTTSCPSPQILKTAESLRPSGFGVPLACPTDDDLGCGGTMAIVASAPARRGRSARHALKTIPYAVAPGARTVVHVRLGVKDARFFETAHRFTLHVTLAPLAALGQPGPAPRVAATIVLRATKR